MRALDSKFAAKGRNVLLFIDNCTAHCDLEGLQAFQLIFLPKTQRLCSSVIQNLQTLYRRRIVELMLLCLDSEKTYADDIYTGICIALPLCALPSLSAYGSS